MTDRTRDRHPDHDLPGLVLVHGGAHAGDCWDLTVAELRRFAPDLEVLAVNLPGRQGVPGDLMTATFAEWVDSALTQIDGAGLRDVVLVGHSLAGLSVPRMAAKLGRARVRGMIFIACTVPDQGRAMVDTLVGPLRRYGVWVGRRGKPLKAPDWFARYLFCNGMTAAQQAFTLARCRPESTSIFLEPADRCDLPDDIPRAWILTTRDRAMTPRSQRRSIAALGGECTVLSVDSGHDVMISEPRWLAEVLIGHCRLWS
ncbi:alpha/beta fold hydrolase [Mycobacterium sp.]|uniref:alpha/beta fold hydrolase n=1 Tax=Mycobacterium sp. TaxID=1785 RepID=UPI003D121455